jgi:ribosome-binding protein aMBF1 (putative translation factor)
MGAMAPGDLGIRIKRARERLNMSQADLARAVNRSVRALGSWERGEAVPRNAIGALEHVLGVDLTGGDVYSDTYAEAYTDPDEARIWGWVEYAPHERRAMISALREARAGKAG